MTGNELLAAAALDALVGDPRWLPHPVRAMGAVITWIDGRVRTICTTDDALRLAGVALAVTLPVGSYLAASSVIQLAGSWSPSSAEAMTILLAATTLAGRDLLDHARAVSRALGQGDLLLAREAVARIVGRDSAQLNESEIVRATVETVAESTADGIIAPIVYLTLGGVPLALAYKAVNTLDSMIGHRDARYEHFGWASAKLDDVMNWVPARLAGTFIALAAGFATGRWERVRDSLYCLHRDGDKHPSPNSGQPEAAMAGALGVQLGGVNHYDGVPHERPFLGEGRAVLQPGDIDEALRIMVGAWALGVGFALLSLWL